MESLENNLPQNDPSAEETPVQPAAQVPEEQLDPAASSQQKAAPVEAPQTEEPAEVAAAPSEVAQVEVLEEGADAPSEEEAEEAERRRLAAETEKQLKAAIANILHAEDEEYMQVLSQATLHELILLMEVVAVETIERKFLRRVGMLKKRYDEVWEKTLTYHKEIRPEDTEGQKEKQRNVDFSIRFNEALAKFNKRKEGFEVEDNKQREVNSRLKQELVNQLREIVHKEDASLQKQVRDIQQKWKDIGPVQSQYWEELNESYKALLDQFYSLRSSYLDLMDQGRKTNLEAKQKLVAEAEQLSKPTEEEGIDPNWWNAATDKLNALHEEWRQVGAVPRKDSEQVWQAFKAATEAFYQTRRAFYDTRDELRERNQDIKADMVQKMQNLAAYTSEDVQGWQSTANEVKQLQEAFFSQGPAPKEVNSDMNKQFKTLANEFFKHKQEFFKTLDDQRTGLLKQKEALTEQAVQLADSEDWEPTVQKMKELQVKWKDTGSDMYKEARKLQTRFRKACDHFFKRLKNRHQVALEKEQENLGVKEQMAAELEALVAAQQPETLETKLTDEARAALTQAAEEIQTRFQAAGEVPRKAAGKMGARWQAAWNAYLALTVDDPKQLAQIQEESRYHALRSEKGEEAFDRERRRLTRMLKELEEEIMQYENNILFFAKGKKGDSLRKEIQQKIDRAQTKRDKLEKELKILKKTEREAKQA